MAKINPKVELNEPEREAHSKKVITTRAPTLAGAPTRLRMAEIKDDDGNVTGYKLLSDTNKFDAEAKDVVIDEIARHGRIGAAARAAGVTIGTVKRHVKEDKNFAECMGEAIEVYKDKLLAHHQDLVFNGEQKMTYDREGRIISTETRYPVRLIELELKKHDPGYRDKQEIHHEHRGGVMVAPAEVADIDDWEKKFGRKDDTIIEGTVVEDKSED